MKILFRADGAPEMGTGHLSRCMALAHALRNRGHQILFLVMDHPGNFSQILKDQGFDFELIPQFKNYKKPVTGIENTWLGNELQDEISFSSQVIKKFNPAYVVVDHYDIDYRWQKAVKAPGIKIFVIDDLANRQHDCEFLLDQTLGRIRKDYENLIPKNSQTLLGTEFALLREEFSDRPDGRSFEDVKNIFVSMGGSDPRGITLQILKGLEKVTKPLEIDVILKQDSRGFQEVKEIEAKSHHKIRVIKDAKRMSELMKHADIAFGAGGSSAWERCSMALPTLTILVADNQKKVISELSSYGAIINLGPYENVTPELVYESFAKIMTDPGKLLEMSEKARTLCDGKGCERVSDFFR